MFFIYCLYRLVVKFDLLSFFYEEVMVNNSSCKGCCCWYNILLLLGMLIFLEFFEFVY